MRGVWRLSSYVDANLLSGETVVYRARLHLIVYSKAAVLIVIAFMIVRAGLAAVDRQGEFLLQAEFLLLSGIAALFAAVVNAGFIYLNVKAAEFVVTNRRVLIKVGWLRRKSLELFLQKVEAISVDQGIIGRILNFGTIVVRGTGGSRESFKDISGPLEFRRQVQLQIPQES